MSTAPATLSNSALWPSRWPLIALQVCIDKVQAAPVEERNKVKWDLPCQDCPKNTACQVAKRKELGPLLFDREIQTSPRSSESSLFPRLLFSKFLDREAEFVPYYRKPFSMEHRYGVASAWDLAWSEKIGGDWMVKMTGVVDRQTGVKTLIDILRVQKLSFKEQVLLIESEWGKYGDDAVVIEADAAQAIWSQHVSATTAVPVLPHTAGGKGNLAIGVPGLIMQIENGEWRWPSHPGSFHAENLEVFLSEAEAFGWVDGKLQGVGEHDDTVMAWWHLSWILKMLQHDDSTKRAQHRGVQQGAYI